jgi:hypothetical protein
MKIAQLTFLCAFGLTVLAGCGDDHHDDDGHGEATAACQAIVDACHEVDHGNGDAHDCHGIAHENHDEDCVSEQDRCVALCEAALADGGGHHDEDGGHE